MFSHSTVKFIWMKRMMVVSPSGYTYNRINHNFCHTTHPSPLSILSIILTIWYFFHLTFKFKWMKRMMMVSPSGYTHYRIDRNFCHTTHPSTLSFLSIILTIWYFFHLTFKFIWMKRMMMVSPSGYTHYRIDRNFCHTVHPSTLSFLSIILTIWYFFHLTFKFKWMKRMMMVSPSGFTYYRINHDFCHSTHPSPLSFILTIWHFFDFTFKFISLNTTPNTAVNEYGRNEHGIGR